MKSLFIALSLLLAGCASQPSDGHHYHYTADSLYTKRVMNANEASIGSTKAQVIEACGKPNSITTLKSASQSREDWLYTTTGLGSTILSFDGDSLVEIRHSTN